MTGFIMSGVGGAGVDVSDTTLLQNEAISGKYFYLADGTKVQGTMPVKEGILATPTTSEQLLVPAGTYAKGDQKIAAIKTQIKTVTPTGSQQIITPSSGYYFNQVTVQPAVLDAFYITTVYYDDNEYSNYKMILPCNGKKVAFCSLQASYALIDDLSTSREYVVSLIIEDINDPYCQCTTLYFGSHGWEFDNSNYVESVVQDNDNLIITLDTHVCFLNTVDAGYRVRLYTLD